jgi:hypothetical protein
MNRTLMNIICFVFAAVGVFVLAEAVYQLMRLR